MNRTLSPLCMLASSTLCVAPPVTRTTTATLSDDGGFVTRSITTASCPSLPRTSESAGQLERPRGRRARRISLQPRSREGDTHGRNGRAIPLPPRNSPRASLLNLADSFCAAREHLRMLPRVRFELGRGSFSGCSPALG